MADTWTMYKQASRALSKKAGASRPQPAVKRIAKSAAESAACPAINKIAFMEGYMSKRAASLLDGAKKFFGVGGGGGGGGGGGLTREVVNQYSHFVEPSTLDALKVLKKARIQAVGDPADTAFKVAYNNADTQTQAAYDLLFRKYKNGLRAEDLKIGHALGEGEGFEHLSDAQKDVVYTHNPKMGAKRPAHIRARAMNANPLDAFGKKHNIDPSDDAELALLFNTNPATRIEYEDIFKQMKTDDAIAAASEKPSMLGPLAMGAGVTGAGVVGGGLMFGGGSKNGDLA
jgi:hypothetical protein